MKALRVWVPVVALLLLPIAAAQAGTVGATHSGSVGGASHSRCFALAMTHPYGGYVQSAQVGFFDLNRRKRSDLLDLRAEMFKMRKADGGELTDEHRQYIESKFDAILQR